MKCVFGDWECPVSGRLEEMQRELVSSMKTTSADPEKGEIFQEYMGKMLSALSSPLITLANFCQACPIARCHYKRVEST